MNIDDKLKEFLKKSSKKENNYSLLIKGKWGSGKTYFIKNFLSKNIKFIYENNFKYIKYINASILGDNFSVLGELIRDVDKIKGGKEFVKYSFLLNRDIELKNNYLKGIKKMFSGIKIPCLGTISNFTPIVSHILEIAAEKKINNVLVVIDELDRVNDSFDLKLFFSQIINIQEKNEKNISFVLLLSEENLSDENKNILNLWREKVFSYEIKKVLDVDFYEDVPDIEGYLGSRVKKEELSNRVINKYKEVEQEINKYIKNRVKEKKLKEEEMDVMIDGLNKDIKVFFFDCLLSYYLSDKFDKKELENKREEIGVAKKLISLEYNIIDDEIKRSINQKRYLINKKVEDYYKDREYLNNSVSELDFFNSLLRVHFLDIEFYAQPFFEERSYEKSFLSLVNKVLNINIKNNKDIGFINKIIKERIEADYHRLIKSDNLEKLCKGLGVEYINRIKNERYKNLKEKTNIENEVNGMVSKIVKDEMEGNDFNINNLHYIVKYLSLSGVEKKGVVSFLIDSNKKQKIKISEIKKILESENNGKGCSMLEEFEKEIERYFT